MADESDIRSKRLQWIREGSNWLVGLSAGALVLSGTYFYDRFDRTPSAVGLLVSSWILLAVSVLFGVLTSFAAWRDLRAPSSLVLYGVNSERRLGGWVAHCYTAMMWSFLFGYLALAAVLILNALRPPLKTEVKTEVRIPCGAQSFVLLTTSAIVPKAPAERVKQGSPAANATSKRP